MSAAPHKPVQEPTPKTVYTIVQAMRDAAFATPPARKEPRVVRKAFCKSKANQTVVIGSSAFTFDAEGICELIPNYRASQFADFDILLTRPGVSEYFDTPKSTADGLENLLAPPPVVEALPAVQEESPVVETASEEPTSPEGLVGVSTDERKMRRRAASKFNPPTPKQGE